VGFGTCNVRSVYRAGSLTATTMELARYKLDLVIVQEGMWDKGGTVRAREYIFFMEKEMKINWEQDFFHDRKVSTVKRVEFVSDRIPYIVLRGRWFNIIFLNVHTLSEEKSDDSKDS
jgi:uncharacterized UBP type Zn finger protein